MQENIQEKRNIYKFVKSYWLGILIILVVLSYFIYQNAFTDNSYSSFIERAKYSPFTNSLEISIRGTNYKYCNVPSKTWREYKNVSSKGTFYNSAIKGKYSCANNNNKSDWVFDHIIPLCLGGKDFSMSSQGVTGESFGVSDELAVSCFKDMVQEERDTLSRSGYKRLSDGSWIDKDKQNPSCEFGSDLELSLSKKFQECIVK
jgi:hypothetical protein